MGKGIIKQQEAMYTINLAPLCTKCGSTRMDWHLRRNKKQEARSKLVVQNEIIDPPSPNTMTITTTTTTYHLNTL